MGCAFTVAVPFFFFFCFKNNKFKKNEGSSLVLVHPLVEVFCFTSLSFERAFVTTALLPPACERSVVVAFSLDNKWMRWKMKITRVFFSFASPVSTSRASLTFSLAVSGVPLLYVARCSLLLLHLVFCNQNNVHPPMSMRDGFATKNHFTLHNKKKT